MIIEFKVSNFRSIREEVVLSMVAEPSKSKEMNFWEQPLSNSDPVRLLKIAAIYGPNAAGKSNLLRAMYNLGRMLGYPSRAGEDILEYDPFLFDPETRTAPTTFDLTFIGLDNIKFRYKVKFDATVIWEELLEYYPQGSKRTCYHRIQDENGESISTIRMGNDFKNRKVKVLVNQLLLPKFGDDEPDEILSSVYVSLRKILVVNACSDLTLRVVQRWVTSSLNANKELHARLDEIIRGVDIRINGIQIVEQNEEDYHFPKEFPEEEKSRIVREFRFQVSGLHNVYKNGNLIGTDSLPLDKESHGTNTLFILAGLILLKMKDGGTLFVDELDASLHPDLTRMLVQLYQDENTNPGNAQLIFTTHDTNLMDSGLLRKDQIWFADKNELGETDFYSLQDFEGVRETTPFDKWYSAGKFGAKPNIKSPAF
ncbi:MAG: ATP-binding protein [Bacteroidia bacterium]|nr:ATP-binding protein [Bacteroidia bacterium]